MGTSKIQIVGVGGGFEISYRGAKSYTGCGEALFPSNAALEISISE